MKLTPRLISSAVVLAVTCVVTATAYYYNSRKTEVNDVMIFCKLQFNAYNYFDKLIGYVEAAKKSINICMPSIHNVAIQGRLLKVLVKNGITMRIIIDRKGYNESTKYLINELIEAGAQVKYNDNDEYKMNHKFCVIDDKVLMSGTLDWGNDLSSNNWNYVYVTNKAQLVTPVKTEFYRMWSQFSSDLKLTPDSDSELELEDLDNVSNDTEIPSLRETQSTPELCIM